MLNRILGGVVRDKHGKYENKGKYGISKYRRERKYMGRKGIGICERKYDGGEIWSGHAQVDFGRGSVGQNGKYRRKRKYGNVERDTSKTIIAGVKIGRRANSS